MDIRLQNDATVAGMYFPKDTFRDLFDRPDAATLGVTTEAEIPWEISLGTGVTAATFGIEANSGKLQAVTGSGFVSALIDVHQQDFQVSWIIAARATAMRLPICARDAGNAIYIGYNGSGNITLYRTTNGSSAIIASALPVVNAGDVLRARFTGGSLLVWINGVSIYSAPLTAVPTDYTKTGFGAVGNVNGGRIDQITVSFP
ncbi:hypothetical protein LJR186_001241 [Microbacterium foliorum]